MKKLQTKIIKDKHNPYTYEIPGDEGSPKCKFCHKTLLKNNLKCKKHADEYDFEKSITRESKRLNKTRKKLKNYKFEKSDIVRYD